MGGWVEEKDGFEAWEGGKDELKSGKSMSLVEGKRRRKGRTPHAGSWDARSC